MPTYDFKCLECGKQFERSQKMSEEPLRVCIYCKGKVERLIGTGGGIIFKGSGFYATDYKKPDKTPKASEKKSEKKKE